MNKIIWHEKRHQNTTIEIKSIKIANQSHVSIYLVNISSLILWQYGRGDILNLPLICHVTCFYSAEQPFWLSAHSPVEQQTLSLPQEVFSGHVVSGGAEVFVHVLATPPPSSLTWQLPHNPFLTLFPAAVSLLPSFPQNGFIGSYPILSFAKQDSAVHYKMRCQ